MVEIVEYKTQKKRLLKLGLLGTCFAALSYVTMTFEPLSAIVSSRMTMHEGSYLFKIWQKPTINVYLKVYIFNITNAEAFLNKSEKLRVNEVGPYVFQEFLENTNATFNINGSLSYVPKRRVAFVPEMSIGDPDTDRLIVPNIPLLGVSSAVTEVTMLASFAASMLAKSFGSKPILNLSVSEYLWGYHDPLVEMASAIVPKYITFKSFGLLDRMFDDGNNIVTMNLNANVDVDPDITNMSVPPPGKYSIQLWNGSPGLAHWGYEHPVKNETVLSNKQCNMVAGSYEGGIFPQGITPSTQFNVYRKAFCRTLPIEYSHSGMTDIGLEGYWFKLTKNAFNMEEKENNSCYCNEEKCLPKGLSDVTPCYYNIPAAVSLPHFYKSDPSLLLKVDGLNPDPDKHETVIVIQPKLGVPMHVNSRIQTNLVMKRTKFNLKIKPFDDMIVPIFWTDLCVERLPDDITTLIYWLFVVLPAVERGFVYASCVLGIMLFAAAALSFVYLPKRATEYSPIRYTAIRVLPFFTRDYFVTKK